MYYSGIDIGGMSIKVGIVNENGEILINRAIATDSSSGFSVMVSNMATLIKELLLELSIKENDLSGIGIGIPGVADSKKGIVTTAVNIGWRNVNVVEEFHKYFKMPVRISNDANCAALGEQRFGAAKGKSDVIMVTLGTGVGAGIIIDGKLIEGNGSAGAEAGHMIINMHGLPCACNGHGCWEQYASATALIRQTKLAMAKNPTSLMHDVFKEKGKVSGRTAFIAAERGDRAGQEVVDEYISYVSVGLIGLGNVLHPEVFVIGGGISHEKERLTAPIKRYLDNYIAISGFYPEIDVVPASLGNDAGIIGAAALVM